MPIDHNKIHYAIGAAALALAGYGISSQPASVNHAVPGIHEAAKPGRLDWADLGQDKTIALGEALKGVAPGNVKIFCAATSCHALALDLDDAFQIAEWKSDFEDRVVDSEADAGLFVGPPGPNADSLASVIEKTTGMKATIVGIDGIDGLGIIIGKHGSAK